MQNITSGELDEGWDRGVATYEGMPRRPHIAAHGNAKLPIQLEIVTDHGMMLLAVVHHNGKPATLLRLKSGNVAIFRGVVPPREVLDRAPQSISSSWTTALQNITKAAQEEAFYWPAKTMPIEPPSFDGKTKHYVVWRDLFVPIRMYPGGFKFNAGIKTYQIEGKPWEMGRQISAALEMGEGPTEDTGVVIFEDDDIDSPFEPAPPKPEHAHPPFGLM